LFPQFFITNNNINNNDFIAFANILAYVVLSIFLLPQTTLVMYEDDQKRLHILHV